jgi:lactoylglutathione lyase
VEQESTKPETNVQQAVPFFRLSNIEASVRYYVDGLGFQMTKKWIDEGKLHWCWLQHGDAALMLQEFRKEGQDSWVPAGKVGEGVSIYFQCQDALEIFREATSRGIQTNEPCAENNMWVISLSDPDGYKIEFEARRMCRRKPSSQSGRAEIPEWTAASLCIW